MTKHEFFNTFEKQLSEKYKITLRQVSTIRSFVIGNRKSRKEIAEWIVTKLQISIKAGHPSIHYQSLLNFIASCSPKTWDDITQLTEFDKKADTATGVS